MERPAGIEAVQEKRGTCWSCGRKRSLSLWYAAEEVTEEPIQDPGAWDPEHRLNCPFTPAKGLELPVAGATGYASVQLPLWAQLPQGQEGKLAAMSAAGSSSFSPLGSS